MPTSRTGCCLLALALLSGHAARGAAQEPIRDSTAPQPATGAPVVLDGDTLFTLYANLGPFTPDQRARAVSDRLRRLAPRLADGRDSLQVVEQGGHSEILAGDQVLMTVLDGDATPLGETRGALAGRYAGLMLQVSGEVSERTSLRALLIEIGLALLATLVLLLAIRGISRGADLVQGAINTRQLPRIRVQRFELLSAAQLRTGFTLLLRVVRIAVLLLLVYVYLTTVLSLFPWTAPYARRITGYVVRPFAAVWAGFLDYLPKLFYLAVIALVTRYIIRLLLVVFRGLERGALVIQGFHRDWAMPTYKIARFLVIALALVLMIPYLPGAGSEAFKGVSIFLGVLLSFGSSGAIGNLIAGVVLTYTRAFAPGDRVRINETVGDVIERTLLVTRVRTIKNVDVTIPNGSVLQSHVINYSTSAADRGLVLNTSVTIGYDVPWRQVHQLLTDAARATGGILADPAPFVLQTSLNDFHVSYELNAYTDQPQRMAVIYSELHQQIQDSFARAGVEILSPHYRAMRDGNPSTVPAAMGESGNTKMRDSENSGIRE